MVFCSGSVWYACVWENERARTWVFCSGSVGYACVGEQESENMLFYSGSVWCACVWENERARTWVFACVQWCVYVLYETVLARSARR